MKKTIILLLVYWTTVTMSFAQNIIDFDIPITIKESYLVSLFEQYEIVYCDYDVIEENLFIKKIELIFFDSTYFFSAFILSSLFTLDMYEGKRYQCVFIEIDDGGWGLRINEEELLLLEDLKTVLDAILRETPLRNKKIGVGDSLISESFFYLFLLIKTVKEKQYI